MTKSDKNLNVKVTPQILSLLDLLVKAHNKGGEKNTRRQVLVAGLMLISSLLGCKETQEAAMGVYNTERKKGITDLYLKTHGTK